LACLCGVRPLRIGAISTDHFFTPCKAVARALLEATEALEKAGHEVVQTDLPMNGASKS
jgi:Asp-tRNA(Asn)/Glu-tRNA(Gln) amidotransferase A subunit family amidase